MENRPQILNLDGLPAETTFVWDPISDRLVAVFKAGATATTDANGGLLKQIIHGDSSYDDPLETATIDPSTGNVTYLYPIYDEAGGGSLQAIVNETGEVVARNLAQDPYGAEDAILAGAAIDGVKVDVKKVSGTIDTVDVTLHATEELAQSSIANGARLAVVDSNGNLVRTATVAPDLDATDKFTLRWSLSAAEWSALTDPTPVTINGVDRTPVALSVGATANLRASNWSSQLPILPPPDWVKATKPVFTTADLTVEIREPLSSPTLTAALSAGNTAKLYEVDAIALLAEPGAGEEFSQDIMSARMHAHPFTEPMTRLNYVRARWFDPASGTFLSADPMGYGDSSNLYAFGGGDPVNGRDPTGTSCLGIGDKPCGELWRQTVDELMEQTFGQVPSTGSKELDQKMRQVNETATRAMLSPGGMVAGVGESTGEYLYRMERASFHGELAIDPTNVDDQLLLLGVTTDVMTFIAPFEMLDDGIGLELGNKNATAQPKRGVVSGREEITKKIQAAKAGDLSSAGEIDAAKALRAQGRNVHFRTAAGDLKGTAAVQGQRTSDFLVDGIPGSGTFGTPYEVFTPAEKTSAKGIVSALAKKLSQSDRFIVNLSESTLTPADLARLKARVNGVPGISQKAKEILFVKNGAVVGSQ
ncbi:MAG TPA: RHS repeat-associated core domain-containing protein [Thermoanaerobaculia bacterium]